MVDPLLVAGRRERELRRDLVEAERKEMLPTSVKLPYMFKRVR